MSYGNFWPEQRLSYNGNFVAGQALRGTDVVVRIRDMRMARFVDLPLPPNAHTAVTFGLSRDGSRALVGSELGAPSFYWRRDRPNALVRVPQPTGNGPAEVVGLSDDGLFVVGWALTGSAWRSFRWSEARGVELLPSSNQVVLASAVNQDGSVIAGRGTFSGGTEGFVWTSRLGVRALRSLLRGSEIPSPSWQIERVLDVSAGGTAFLVIGRTPINPAGTFERHGYVVHFASIAEMESR
jgi:hypothetical protein